MDRAHSKLAFIGGKVYTPFGYKEAILIEGERISFVGNSIDADLLANNGYSKINLDGRTVIPGLCDSHLHFLAWASNSDKLDLKGSKSINDVRKKLIKFVSNLNYADFTENSWIEGRGWNQELFESGSQKMPTRYDIDNIVPNVPTVLSRVCGHVGVINTAALNKLGINRDTVISGGIIDLGADGHPNGIIREAALELVWNSIPSLDNDDLYRLLHKYGKIAASFGLTTINSDDLSELNDDYERAICFYSKAECDGKMPFRVRQQFLLRTHQQLREFLGKGWRTGMGSKKYKIGPLKILCDGSLGGRTALLREEYADEPGSKGIPIHSQEDLDEFVWLAHSSGMQVAMHAIGDAALDMCLDSVERAKKLRVNSLRHIIVHCQIADDFQLIRLKRLGMGAAIQPCFVPSDREMAIRRLGYNKASCSYRWKTMIDKGIIISAGSDAPVESVSPLLGIHAAVTRQDENRHPYRGWGEKERLSIASAINMYTWASAWHANEESIRGEIVEGKLADFVILEDDIFSMAPEKIKDIRVSMTICGGNITYKR
ncbi:MAG: amidohydrolase [Synergistaceae bacterium]|nr:amidohydrolase [Synergistaceae bacterium]